MGPELTERINAALGTDAVRSLRCSVRAGARLVVSYRLDLPPRGCLGYRLDLPPRAPRGRGTCGRPSPTPSSCA